MGRTGRLRQALSQLGAVQKSGRGAPPYSRWVNRWLARYLAATAYVLGLRPNHVTALGSVLTFGALVLVALVPPSGRLGLLVTAMLLVGYCLDSADGQLARLQGGGSRAGEWLDHFLDAVKVSMFHSVILVSFYRFGDNPSWALLSALAFQSVYSLMYFGLIFIDLFRRGFADTHGKPSAKGGGGYLQTLAASPLDYGFLCMIFLVFGWPGVFQPLYAVLFALNLALLVVAIWRWWREVNRMDAALAA